jgi:hypothetical protein
VKKCIVQRWYRIIERGWEVIPSPKTSVFLIVSGIMSSLLNFYEPIFPTCKNTDNITCKVVLGLEILLVVSEMTNETFYLVPTNMLRISLFYK